MHSCTGNSPLSSELSEQNWIRMDSHNKDIRQPLADVWRTIEFSAKEELVRQVEKYSSSLFKDKLRGIGNIFPGAKSVPLEVKRISSVHFFLGKHITQDVPRGPFHKSRGWLVAYLEFNEIECNSIISEPQYYPDADIKDQEATLRIIKRLKSYLDDFFPSKAGSAEPSILFHDDFSMHNILASDDGVLTGVVDWECVSAMPLWKACDLPTFLQGSPMNDKPDKWTFGDDSDEEEMYWKYLEQYEITKLSRYFIDEMRRLEPEWVKVYESSEKQRDFAFAA